MKVRKLAVMHYLNAAQFAALLWEGSPNFNIGKETVEELLESCRELGKRVPVSFHQGVRIVVTDELRSYGETSMEKGPQRGWKDEQQREWYEALVSMIYGLEEK